MRTRNYFIASLFSFSFPTMIALVFDWGTKTTPLIIVICAGLVGMIFLIAGFNNDTPSRYNKQDHPQLKDVKSGETITIEWQRAQPNICRLLCINNDPPAKKILLQVKWNDYIQMNLPQYEQIIFSYKAKELKNFRLLNSSDNHQGCGAPEDFSDQFDISAIQKQMNEALEKEEYEKADSLQKRINEILNTK